MSIFGLEVRNGCSKVNINLNEDRKSGSSRYIDNKFFDPIRVLALPAVSVQIADRYDLQRLLLNGPRQIDLWLQLVESTRGEQEQERAPKPLIVVARHTAKAVAKSTDQRRATDSSVPSSGVGLSPGSTRPNQLRFHPDGCSEAQSELSLVLAELLDLAQTNQQPVIVGSLVIALVEPLSPHQPAEAAYGLSHWACKQERFVVAAVALAEQVVNYLLRLDLLGRMLFSLYWLADLGLQLVQLCQIKCNQSCSWIIQISGSKLLSLEVGNCLISEVGC